MKFFKIILATILISLIMGCVTTEREEKPSIRGTSPAPASGEIIFCSEQPGDRDYVLQHNATYRPGATVYLYFELNGMAVKKENDKYRVHVKLSSLKLYDPNDDVKLNIRDFIDFDAGYPEIPSYIWFAPYINTSKDGPLGQYKVEIIVSDLIENQEYFYSGVFRLGSDTVKLNEFKRTSK